MRFAWALVLAAACGAPQAPIAAPSQTGPEAARTLDWAMLLPLETLGLMRVDLARVRRSPHRGAIQPRLGEILVDVNDPGMRGGFGPLLDRTDVVLVGMVPPVDPAAAQDELIVFVRGDYRADEIDRLYADGTPIEVEGYRVLRAPDGGRLAIVQLRPDTLVLAASLDQLQRLLARTRMVHPGNRWPPAVRELVDSIDLEHSTFGVALANGNLGAGEGEDGLSMSLAGRADFDGPLDIQVLVELGDPAIAATAAMIFHAMLFEIARSAQGSSTGLQQLVQLARIEPVGSRVTGSIHADREVAYDLVPSLLALFTSGIAAQEAPMATNPIRPSSL